MLKFSFILLSQQIKLIFLYILSAPSTSFLLLLADKLRKFVILDVLFRVKELSLAYKKEFF